MVVRQISLTGHLESPQTKMAARERTALKSTPAMANGMMCHVGLRMDMCAWSVEVRWHYVMVAY